MKTSVRALALVLVGALATAVPASGATVALSLDQARSSVPQGSTFALPSGATAFQAPFTGFKFTATVTNDAGAPAVPPAGVSTRATVDLVARTVDGEKVLNTQTIFDAGPVAFTLQFIDQSTTYYARLNAEPAVGVAAPTASNEFTAPTYLRNYPTAFRSNVTNKVTFSGFYSNVATVPASTAVRVVIQRRIGSKWKSIKTVAPNAKREWKVVVPTGAMPAVFRVRTVPVGPQRYIPITEMSYCVARTAKLAQKACKSVTLGP